MAMLINLHQLIFTFLKLGWKISISLENWNVRELTSQTGGELMSWSLSVCAALVGPKIDW